MNNENKFLENHQYPLGPPDYLIAQLNDEIAKLCKESQIKDKLIEKLMGALSDSLLLKKK